MREAAITAQFCHDNVVGLVGVVTRGDPCLMVLQLCERGALDSLVKGEDIPVSQLTMYSRDVAVGMEFLAGRSFVHRDLAARNVLVDARNIAKIADFGMSKDLQDSQYYSTAGGRALPLRWIAPEIFTEARFGESSDVWSFAVTVIETFSKAQTPYSGWGNLFVAEKVMAGYRLPRPPRCPEIVYTECVRPCFALEPRDRPRFREIAASLQRIVESEICGGGGGSGAGGDGAGGVAVGYAVPTAVPAAPATAASVDTSPGDCYAMSSAAAADADPGADADDNDDESVTPQGTRTIAKIPDPVDVEAVALAMPEAPHRCRNSTESQVFEPSIAEAQLYELPMTMSIYPATAVDGSALLDGNPDADVPTEPNLYKIPTPASAVVVLAVPVGPALDSWAPEIDDAVGDPRMAALSEQRPVSRHPVARAAQLAHSSEPNDGDLKVYDVLSDGSSGSVPLTTQMLAEVGAVSAGVGDAPVPPVRPQRISYIVDGVEFTQDEADALETKSEDSAYDFIAAKRATQTGPKPAASSVCSLPVVHPPAPLRPQGEEAHARACMGSTKHASPSAFGLVGSTAVPEAAHREPEPRGLSPRLPKKAAVPALHRPKHGKRRNQVGPKTV